MSKNSTLSLLFILFVTCVTAQSLIEKTLSLDGLERNYFVYVPAGLDANKKYPLVLVLHGGGGNAKQTIDFCGFNPLADKEKFIVLYPNGYKKGWHDGREAPEIDANKKNIDDVEFINTIIDAAKILYPVDPDRIFSTGISNGAMMSLHLACKLSNQIRAIAPVCGNIAENEERKFKPANPVAVLVINGTEDKLVLYNGGPVVSERANRGRVIGTDKMMEIWMNAASTNGKPISKTIPDADPSDGCKAVRLSYPSQKNNPIELIRITGGGHTWPGGKQYLPKFIVGRVCRDFKAEVVIWEFFKNIQSR